MTSLAPKVAKWRAIARPMPRDAPVTIATLSWSGSAVVVVVVGEGCSIDVGFVCFMLENNEWLINCWDKL